MSVPRPSPRTAGILIPVSAIRSSVDLGVGDTRGVRELIDWCARHRLGVLQILPINETSDDNSPYNAISSLALEPSTIAADPDALPDLTPEDFGRIATRDRLDTLRAGPVRYAEVRALKADLLSAAFRNFEETHAERGTPRDLDFRSFRDEHAAWLGDYGLFRALMERNGGWPTWERWPAEQQDPGAARAWLQTLPSGHREAVEERIRFFTYVQWIAFRQWESVRHHGTERGVALMGDIPFGVGRSSADVWANRAVFDLDWSGGCPPERIFKVDPFTEKWGQNWGIPLYRWDVLRVRGFDWWRTRVGNLRRAFHAFRIDHVLGFFRIYSFPWSPDRNAHFLPLSEEQAAAETGGRLPHFQQGDDATPENRAVNQSQGEELLRMILDAAGDTAVVAEDLGVVPPYVPPTLHALGIPGFAIPFLMRNAGDPYPAPETFPELAVTAPATHDHPPLRAAWDEGWRTIDARGEESAEGRAALAELRAIHAFATGTDSDTPPRAFTQGLHEGFLAALMRSPARMVICLFADILGTGDRYNTPGSVGDPNWTPRLDRPVGELDADPAFAAHVARYTALVREHGRCG
jgi:4-alpha-glucanotransferase